MPFHGVLELRKVVRKCWLRQPPKEDPKTLRLSYDSYRVLIRLLVPSRETRKIPIFSLNIGKGVS